MDSDLVDKENETTGQTASKGCTGHKMGALEIWDKCLPLRIYVYACTLNKNEFRLHIRQRHQQPSLISTSLFLIVTIYRSFHFVRILRFSVGK